MRTYDAIVIGVGTAGETAAGLLRDAGKTVAIIDQGPVGGTCALRGCQPKKVLVVNTHLAAETRALVGRGFSQPAVTDWSSLQRFKHVFTDPIPENTERSLRESGIDVYVERAAFVGPREIELAESGQRLKADRVLIAVGARSRELSIPGADLAATSDDFLDLTELPESLIFIGGGYISLEFAFLAALSGSRVTVLQRGSRILPQFPASLVDPVVEEGVRHGITFHADVAVTGIGCGGSEYRVTTQDHGTLHADWVMGAIGRVPNVDEMGLDAAGVKATSHGIAVNEYLETTAPGVYAAGDCVATKQLSPVGDMEARIAAANMLDSRSTAADYDAIPSVVFTHPQMASVGLTAAQARERGIDVSAKSGRGDGWPGYRRLGGAVVYYETVSETKTDRLLGAHLTSPRAGEQINLFALAIRRGLTAREVRETPWAYPTYTSDVKYMV